MSSVTEGNLGLNYGWAYGERGWNKGMDENWTAGGTGCASVSFYR